MSSSNTITMGPARRKRAVTATHSAAGELGERWSPRASLALIVSTSGALWAAIIVGVSLALG